MELERMFKGLRVEIKSAVFSGYRLLDTCVFVPNDFANDPNARVLEILECAVRGDAKLHPYIEGGEAEYLIRFEGEKEQHLLTREEIISKLAERRSTTIVPEG